MSLTSKWKGDPRVEIHGPGYSRSWSAKMQLNIGKITSNVCHIYLREWRPVVHQCIGGGYHVTHVRLPGCRYAPC